MTSFAEGAEEEVSIAREEHERLLELSRSIRREIALRYCVRRLVIDSPMNFLTPEEVTRVRS